MGRGPATVVCPFFPPRLDRRGLRPVPDCLVVGNQRVQRVVRAARRERRGQLASQALNVSGNPLSAGIAKTGRFYELRKRNDWRHGGQFTDVRWRVSQKGLDRGIISLLGAAEGGPLLSSRLYVLRQRGRAIFHPRGLHLGDQRDQRGSKQGVDGSR